MKSVCGSFAVLIVLAALLGSSGASVASGSGDALARAIAASSHRGAAEPTALDARLAQVAGASVSRARGLGLATEGSRVRVVIEPAAGTAGAAVAARQAGAVVEATAAGLVQALVAPSALEKLARDARVALVRPPAAMVPQGIAGEEVAASGADLLQTGA